MKTLREAVLEAKKSGQALAHFNISTLDMLQAVAMAAREVKVPVIIGVSEGERDALGVKQIAALVKSLKEEYQQEIYLNADHTYSLDRVKEVIEAGFDSVIFDGSALPLSENIKQTAEAVAYARANGGALVEGELGFIGKSSELLDGLPAGVDLDKLTTVAEAKDFVQATGVDLLAPAVGSVHGMMRDLSNLKLNIERIKELSEAVAVPLVLHGGSGTSDDDFLAAIKAGVSVIHVSTELRLTWRNELKLSLADNPDEVAPYKLLKASRLAVQKLAERRLRLFSGLN